MQLGLLQLHDKNVYPLCVYSLLTRLSHEAAKQTAKKTAQRVSGAWVPLMVSDLVDMQALHDAPVLHHL